MKTLRAIRGVIYRAFAYHTLPENLMHWGKIAFWWSMAYLGFQLARVFGG